MNVSMPSPRPFSSAASYYARYRPGYSRDLVALLAKLCSSPLQVAYDLGCGAGGIALPLAGEAERVFAVDPEPAMLAEARRRADADNISNVTFLQSKAEDLPSDLPAPQLVTMGQCFHWMDGPRVLDLLAERLDQGGAVALLTGNPLGLVSLDPAAPAPPSWMTVLETVLQDWCGQGRWKDLDRWVHPAALAREKGWAVEDRLYPELYTRTVDEVIGLCLSFSWCSPEKLGDRQAAFEADAKARLLKAQPDGVFVEKTHRQILVLRRPAARRARINDAVQPAEAL